MKKIYSVHYTANGYNQNKTYPQNFNRRARTKAFVNDLEGAREFAESVNGKVYYLGKRI